MATATAGLGDVDDTVVSVSLCNVLLGEVAGLGKVTPVLGGGATVVLADAATFSDGGGVIAGSLGDADVVADVDGPRPSSTGSLSAPSREDAVSSWVGVCTGATGLETRGTGRPTPLGSGRPFRGEPAASSSDVFGGMMTVLDQTPPPPLFTSIVWMWLVT